MPTFCLNCSIFFKTIFPMLLNCMKFLRMHVLIWLLYWLIRVSPFSDFLRQSAHTFQEEFAFQRPSNTQIPLLSQPCQAESQGKWLRTPYIKVKMKEHNYPGLKEEICQSSLDSPLGQLNLNLFEFIILLWCYFDQSEYSHLFHNSFANFQILSCSDIGQVICLSVKL